MSLYLCVDCGGSKTSAVICNASGEMLGRALGGPSNFAYLTVQAFTDAVGMAVSDALKTCVDPVSVEPVPLPPSSPVFAAAWFGISGVDSPAAVQSASDAMSQLLNIPLGPRLIIANDTALLAAPLRLHPDIKHAIAAIAGTGSCVVSFRQKPEGTLEELARTGGWGWILGDEGGGFHVGRETMRQLLLDTDRQSLGGPPPPFSSLKAKVLERFGVQSALETLTAVHLPDPSLAAEKLPDAPLHLLLAREKRLSSLAPLVFDAAFKGGDAFALQVLRTCAWALAEQIALLCMTPKDDPATVPRAVLADETVLCFGGSLVGIEEYRNLVLEALKEMGHVFRYVEFVEDAAAGGAAGLAVMAQNSM